MSCPGLRFNPQVSPATASVLWKLYLYRAQSCTGIRYSDTPKRVVRKWSLISELAIRRWGLTELNCALGQRAPPFLHDGQGPGYPSISASHLQFPYCSSGLRSSDWVPGSAWPCGRPGRATEGVDARSSPTGRRPDCQNEKPCPRHGLKGQGKIISGYRQRLWRLLP